MGILDTVGGVAGGFARANLRLLDKATGRARRLAGDALGSERRRRRGRDEERGEAKQEPAAREAGLDATQRDAERRKHEELERAATAARRQFARR